MNNWITITAKFSSKCIQCDEWIMQGDTCYYDKKNSVTHYPECETQLKEDKTRLIIFDEQDEDFYLK